MTTSKKPSREDGEQHDVIGWPGIAAVIGYCIYFDHKRRSHPDFKKKLREKRRKLKQGGKYNRTE